MKLKRVVKQDGRYYYIQDLEQRNPKTGRPKQKWHKLTRVDAGELALLAALRASRRSCATSTRACSA